MDLLNEAAQWAVLAFLAVFVVGLTRQLGRFLTPAEADRATEMGPDLGRPVTGLLSTAAADRIQTAMSAHASDHAAVIVVNQSCDACETWIERLASRRPELSVPVAFLTRAVDMDYRQKLADVGDLLMIDEDERLLGSGIRGWPFLLVIDRNLVLTHKQLGGDAVGFLERLTQEQRPSEKQRSAMVAQ